MSSIRFKRAGVYERLKRGAAQRGESVSSADRELAAWENERKLLTE